MPPVPPAMRGVTFNSHPKPAACALPPPACTRCARPGSTAARLWPLAAFLRFGCSRSPAPMHHVNNLRIVSRAAPPAAGARPRPAAAVLQHTTHSPGSPFSRCSQCFGCSLRRQYQRRNRIGKKTTFVSHAEHLPERRSKPSSLSKSISAITMQLWLLAMQQEFTLMYGGLLFLRLAKADHRPENARPSSFRDRAAAAHCSDGSPKRGMAWR